MSETSASNDLPAVAEPTRTGLPAVVSDGFTETVAFKALDLKINRVKGEFTLDGDPAPRDKVHLVLRGCHKAQSYFGLPYSPGNPHRASCYSVDGKIGYGWIDSAGLREDEVRKCASCPKKGFGAGHCTDLMVMLAYDVDKQTPVMTRFQNQEINQRKGVFTLAVNRFRSMGLAPMETLMTLSFEDVPNASYKAIVIDVEPYELAADKQQMLDFCWTAYEEARAYEVQEILSQNIDYDVETGEVIDQ